MALLKMFILSSDTLYLGGSCIHMCRNITAMTSHENHGVSVHWQNKLTITKTLNHTLLVFMRGIHWSPVDFPHKGPVMQKMFPCHDGIMYYSHLTVLEQLITGSLLDNRTIIGCRFSKASMDKLAISVSHIWDKNIAGTINCYYGQIYDLSASFVFKVFTITGSTSL